MEYIILWMWFAGAVICALVESKGEWDYPFDIPDTLVVLFWPVVCIMLLPVAYYDILNHAINDRYMS